MKSAFITGANKGVGLGTARLLAKRGIFVYIGCRSLEKGLDAVDKLKAEGIEHVEAIQIDVTDEESVKAARLEIGKRIDVLDILINNAGISGIRPQTATGVSIETTKEVFETNLYGVMRVTQAFMDLLQKSTEPRIVNVSSGGCSLTLSSDPNSQFYHHKGAAYSPSKAALNMYTIVLAYELRDTSFKLNAVCPGFAKTDFTNHQGKLTIDEAGLRIAKYALIGNDGPTGKFFSEEYNPETGISPW